MTLLCHSKPVQLSVIVIMSNIKKSPNKRPRMYDKSHAEIVLRVRQYFEQGKAMKQRQNLQKVGDRTAADTETS